MRTIVFLDLDGTLWNHEVIPESALRAIWKARENGHLVFANTGRARSTAQKALESVPLDGCCFSAGSEIWMHGQRIFYQPIPEQEAHEIKEFLSKEKIGFAAEGSRRTFADALDRALLAKHTAGHPNNAFAALPDPEEMDEKDYASIMKFSVHAPDFSKIQLLMDRYGLTFTLFQHQDPGMTSGELTKTECSKATALETIRKLVDPDARTMALGDSDNDIPMLKQADLSFAMGNGTETAKEAADCITESVDQNGLANAFVKAGLIEDFQI